LEKGGKLISKKENCPYPLVARAIRERSKGGKTQGFQPTKKKTGGWKSLPEKGVPKAISLGKPRIKDENRRLSEKKRMDEDIFCRLEHRATR